LNFRELRFDRAQFIYAEPGNLEQLFQADIFDLYVKIETPMTQLISLGSDDRPEIHGPSSVTGSFKMMNPPEPGFYGQIFSDDGMGLRIDDVYVVTTHFQIGPDACNCEFQALQMEVFPDEVLHDKDIIKRRISFEF